LIVIVTKSRETFKILIFYSALFSKKFLTFYAEFYDSADYLKKIF
jgi:hypothetical protein